MQSRIIPEALKKPPSFKVEKQSGYVSPPSTIKKQMQKPTTNI
jgi:hypothetical protein